MCCWCLYKKYRNSQSAIAQQLKWRNFTWMIQIQFQHHHWEHGWHWDAHLARKVLMHCEVPLYVCVYWNPQTLTCLTLKVIVTTCSELWKVFLASSVCVFFVCVWNIFSGLTLLVGWQEGHLACKNWVVRYWHSYLSGARCKWFAYGPADATAIPSSLAPVKSRMVYISGAGLPRLSWKKAVKWMY